MFAELIEWLTTPCPPPARRLGYLREAIAIRARYRRHRQRWQPHLESTRAFVERAAAIPARKRAAVVLGSGALLDVPIDALAAAYERVELIDIVHPREASRAAARLPNVLLRTEDISGAVTPLAAMSPETSSPPQLDPPPKLAADTDFILSLNLLSQLPDVPYNWLGAHTSIPEPLRRNFAAEIVEQHIAWLSQLACRVALVTDIERCYVAPDGRPHDAWDSIYGATLPSDGARWHWEIAGAGEVHPNLSVRMTVCAFDDFGSKPDEPASK